MQVAQEPGWSKAANSLRSKNKQKFFAGVYLAKSIFG